MEDGNDLSFSLDVNLFSGNKKLIIQPCFQKISIKWKYTKTTQNLKSEPMTSLKDTKRGLPLWERLVWAILQKCLVFTVIFCTQETLLIQTWFCIDSWLHRKTAVCCILKYKKDGLIQDGLRWCINLFYGLLSQPWSTLVSWAAVCFD